jgi:hypothetical protein
MFSPLGAASRRVEKTLRVFGNPATELEWAWLATLTRPDATEPEWPRAGARVQTRSRGVADPIGQLEKPGLAESGSESAETVTWGSPRQPAMT